MHNHSGDANNMVTDDGWTTKKPTVAGWYWVRAGDYTSVACLSLHEDSDGMGSRLCVEVGPDDLLPLEEYEPRVQWLGPITPTDRAEARANGLREAAHMLRGEQAQQEVVDSLNNSLTIDTFNVVLEAAAKRIEQAAQGGQKGRQ